MNQKDKINQSDLIIAVGGDGTILRVAHLVADHNILFWELIWVVGFMSEIEESDAIKALPWYFEGNARIEKGTCLKPFL